MRKLKTVAALRDDAEPVRCSAKEENRGCENG